ncbi:MAG TPA: hypothetical protein VHK46_06480 [Gaiellaceae bacterium]|nr:hypothetical protein [Gaiellaceae bacterium]
MVTLEVLPRPTPEERHDTFVPVEVEDGLAESAEVIGEWTSHRAGWEFSLQEGHDFGRSNNVEGRLLFVAGEQTSSVVFRLDQLDGAEDVMDALVLRFEEEDGIAKLVRCTANGVDVELHHILTYT